MKQKEPKNYRSTLGKFSLTAIGLLIATLSLSQYYFLGDIIGAIITLVTAIFTLSVLYVSLRYQITNHSLEVVSIFSKKEIDIFQISSLHWVQSFYNQPNVYSFSEVRLRIVYCYGQYIDISPQHSEDFIETLLAINPMIQLQNEPIMQE